MTGICSDLGDGNLIAFPLLQLKRKPYRVWTRAELFRPPVRVSTSRLRFEIAIQEYQNS
jgi:hypothetical protein